jgi:hypothetical protein
VSFLRNEQSANIGRAWSRSMRRASRTSGRAIACRLSAAACGHDVLIRPSALLQGLHLAPTTLILDLESRLRCREKVSAVVGKAAMRAGRRSCQ